MRSERFQSLISYRRPGHCCLYQRSLGRCLIVGGWSGSGGGRGRRRLSALTQREDDRSTCDAEGESICLQLLSPPRQRARLTQLAVIGARARARVCACAPACNEARSPAATNAVFVFFSNPLTNYYPPPPTAQPPQSLWSRINKWLDRRPLGYTVIRPLKDLRGSPAPKTTLVPRFLIF